MVWSWKIIDVNQKKYWTQDRTLWNHCFGVYLVGQEAIDADMYYTTNYKVRKPPCHFGGKV